MLLQKQGQRKKNAKLERERIHDLELESQQTQAELNRLKVCLEEKDKEIENIKQQWRESQETISKLTRDYDHLEQKCAQSEEHIITLQEKLKEKSTENIALENLIASMEETQDVELEEKNKLLEDNKLLEESIIERDERIKLYEKEIQEILDVSAKLKIEHSATLDKAKDKLETQSKEFARLQKRFENLNELYQHEKEEKKSRIPVPSTPLTDNNIVYYKDQLAEKTAQNKALEEAMEQLNEHIIIMKQELQEARQQANQRYRKMMDYMEENRLLKEGIN